MEFTDVSRIPTLEAVQWMGRARAAKFTSCLCSRTSHKTPEKSFNLPKTQCRHSKTPISTSESSFIRANWSTDVDAVTPEPWGAPSFGKLLEIASEMTQRQYTHKRQTPLWPEEKELREQASLRFTFISPPWAEFQTVWLSLFSIAMCINVIIQQKGVKFLLTAESVQSPLFLLITRRECSLVCKGPLNSRLCPDSLAECSFASTFSPSREPCLQAHLHFPYCGCINPSENDLFSRENDLFMGLDAE